MLRTTDSFCDALTVRDMCVRPARLHAAWIMSLTSQQLEQWQFDLRWVFIDALKCTTYYSPHAPSRTDL